MPQRPGLTRPPRGYLAPGGAWPTGPWIADAPRSVRVAAAIASGLRRAIEDAGLTNTAAARRIGISRQALQDVLGGRRLPDLHTVVLAEDALEVQLWPGAGD